MTNSRLPYDDAASPAQMTTDALAAQQNLPEPRPVDTARAADAAALGDSAASSSGPSEVVVPGRAATMAEGLELFHG